jgi:carboxypeptidase Q
MRFICRLALIGSIAISPCLAQSSGRGPSTPEERNKAVQTARKLQMDPLSPDAQADREWLVKWLIEVPDISVKLCSSILGDLGDSKTGKPGALIATMLASEAAFVIENPKKAQDLEAIYLAGLDGSLNAYQSLRKADPAYRVKHLDDLLSMREEGKLPRYIKDAAKKCK